MYMQSVKSCVLLVSEQVPGELSCVSDVTFKVGRRNKICAMKTFENSADGAVAEKTLIDLC